MKAILFITLPLYALDQLTKWLIERWLPFHSAVEVIPGLFNLVSQGATAVHRGEDGRYRVGDSFYAEFKPVFPGQDAGANQVGDPMLDSSRRKDLEREAMTRAVEDSPSTTARWLSPVARNASRTLDSRNTS